MKVALKLVVCWAAYIVALFASGILTHVLNLPQIKSPGSSSSQTQLLLGLGAGALLVLGLYPLVRRIAAPPAVRSFVIAFFFFVALGVNGSIEAKFFTHILDGGIASAGIFYLTQAVLIGAALGSFFGETGQPTGFASHSWLAWSGRVVAAWLAWPVIYFLFGMCVAPIVVPYYNAGIAGLRIPPAHTIFAVQLVRSVTFLACSLPFVALWKGSRRSLWFALGLAHAVVVGFYGLAQATFMPWPMRIAHSIEMTCDSFAYAGLLVLLFAAPRVEKTAAVSLPHQPHPLPL